MSESTMPISTCVSSKPSGVSRRRPRGSSGTARPRGTAGRSILAHGQHDAAAQQADGDRHEQREPEDFDDPAAGAALVPQVFEGALDVLRLGLEFDQALLNLLGIMNREV